MKYKQTNKGGTIEGPRKKRGKETKVTSLPRMEMYAVLGLELGQRIFEKLEKVEDSVEIFARQKSRELNPKPPEAETAE